MAKAQQLVLNKKKDPWRGLIWGCAESLGRIDWIDSSIGLVSQARGPY